MQTNFHWLSWTSISAFNAQGSRLIIVVVQFGAVKICVAAVEALTRKERQDETQFITKVDGFSEFHPPLKANVLFCRFLKKSHPVYDQTQGFWCCVFLTLPITLMLCWKSIASKYHNKLAALTLIILFSEMLKLSKNKIKFPMKIIPLWRKVLNLQEYSVCWNENFKLNSFFNINVSQVVKVLCYIDLHNCTCCLEQLLAMVWIL